MMSNTAQKYGTLRSNTAIIRSNPPTPPHAARTGQCTANGRRLQRDPSGGQSGGARPRRPRDPADPRPEREPRGQRQGDHPSCGQPPPGHWAKARPRLRPVSPYLHPRTGCRQARSCSGSSCPTPTSLSSYTTRSLSTPAPMGKDTKSVRKTPRSPTDSRRRSTPASIGRT